MILRTDIVDTSEDILDDIPELEEIDDWDEEIEDEESGIKDIEVEESDIEDMEIQGAEDESDDFAEDESDDLADGTETVSLNNGVEVDIIPVNPDDDTEEEENITEDTHIQMDESGDTEEDIPIQVSKTFIDAEGDLKVAEVKDEGDKFKLKYISAKDIVSPERRIRKKQSDALTHVVSKTGLLKPIDAVELNDGKYLIIDGYKRYIACRKNGIDKIPVVINTKLDISAIDILEPLYNQHSQYTNNEIVEYISFLEKEKNIYDGNLIEFLLQMPSGDYTKLKDILSDNDEDIVTKLLNDELTISAAFKKLEARRKKESKEAQELKKTEKVYDTESTSDEVSKALDEAGVMGNEDLKLNDDEIKELAITSEDVDKAGEDTTSLDEIVEESKKMKGFEPHKQDWKHREILSPELRKAVLVRDNNTCQICKVIGGQEYTEVLDIHHIIEVYLGGNDDKDNLITACTVCHKLIHLYARGDLHIRPESELSEADRAKFKRIVKLGNIIRQGMTKVGMKKEDLKKVDKAETIGRTKPGTSRQVAG